jgi:hypothetical protein
VWRLLISSSNQEKIFSGDLISVDLLCKEQLLLFVLDVLGGPSNIGSSFPYPLAIDSLGCERFSTLKIKE